MRRHKPSPGARRGERCGRPDTTTPHGWKDRQEKPELSSLLSRFAWQQMTGSIQECFQVSDGGGYGNLSTNRRGRGSAVHSVQRGVYFFNKRHKKNRNFLFSESSSCSTHRLTVMCTKNDYFFTKVPYVSSWFIRITSLCERGPSPLYLNYIFLKRRIDDDLFFGLKEKNLAS